ncbi:hypothetical protein [Amnibacterium sp.]|uniref:hypothetical protein n=1 Tax=Amnibacterium sp. TaxID=1872496 RepID=UPI002630CC8F|nr:hypothetical protein [Amnibacterium sp.]MCU1472241.1 hypothetical protein [Amnibacterium sp.]
MRRREWYGWTATLIVGIAVFALSITVAAHEPWAHYAEPVGAVATGQGLVQLIRGWWRERHDHTSSPADEGR